MNRDISVMFVLFVDQPNSRVMFDFPLMVYRISHIFLPSGLIQSCNPFPSDNEYFFSVGLEFFTSVAVSRKDPCGAIL